MQVSPANRWFSRILPYVLLVLVGCSNPTQPPLLTLTPNPQPVTVLTQTSTLSPTQIETATSIQSETDMPLPTKTASSTLLPTSTPILLPTLLPTQVFKAIEDFLRQGMNCPTPCFMGIIPEQTTLDQAMNTLNRLGQPIFHPNQQDFYSTSYNYHDLSLSIKLEIQNNIVENVEMGIGLVNYKGDPNPRPWRGFSPDILQNKFGSPSQVGFDLVASPSPPDSPSEYVKYNMVLYFEPMKLIVSYEFGLTKEGKILKICPLSDQYEGVRVYFGKDPENLPYFRVPLEKASSLTLDQFSELVIQKSRPACFDISKESFGP